MPELLRRDEIDEVVFVDDREAVDGCRALSRHEGIFAGGSSGAVVSAIRRMAPRLPRPCRVLTILPDRGDRYLDLVYEDNWVAGLPGSSLPAWLCADLAEARVEPSRASAGVSHA